MLSSRSIALAFVASAIVIGSFAALYVWYSDRHSCDSLERVAANPNRLRYLASTLELYFNSLSQKERQGEYRSLGNSRGAKLYETSSMLDTPVVDAKTLGLSSRVSHYISFADLTRQEGFKEIGIWFESNYLVFKVARSEDGQIQLDWKAPYVECSVAEQLFGPRS